MRLSTLIFVLFSIQQLSSKKLLARNNFVSHAINALLQEYFAKISPKIDVVYVCDNKSSSSEKFITQILRNKNDSLVFNVYKIFNIDAPIKLNNSSAIVVFDSAESFRQLCRKIEWQTNPAVRFKHLTYFPGASFSDLEHLKDNTTIEKFKITDAKHFFRENNFINDFSIDNVNFLMETKKSIELVASFLFTPKACKENQFKTINHFGKKATKWETSSFYPDKYQNLHRCKVKIERLGEHLLSHTNKIFINLTNSTETKTSSDFFIYLEEDRDTSYATAFIMFINEKAISKKVIGHYFMFDKLVFLIPQGDLYTSLEKLLAPFEEEVWIAIAVTLSVGFMTIHIINYTGTKVKKFVFGSSVKAPTMNFVSIILVGSQVKTAGRNFARFIFTLFVLWCLIIRTCHQSKLFENLQSDRRKLEAQTFDDLVDKNFTICLEDSVLTGIQKFIEFGFTSHG